MLSKNVTDTTKIAQFFLDKILKKKFLQDRALVVCLSGDLGAGKTTFVQAIAKHLSIKDKINSPTFVIFKKYSLKKLEGYKFLFHLDAYRLKNEKELLQLGWEEILKNKENIVFIEWPENVIRTIPHDALFVYISHTKNGHRKFEFK